MFINIQFEFNRQMFKINVQLLITINLPVSRYVNTTSSTFSFPSIYHI